MVGQIGRAMQIGSLNVLQINTNRYRKNERLRYEYYLFTEGTTYSFWLFLCYQKNKT